MKFVLPIALIAGLAAIPAHAQTEPADPHQHGSTGAAASHPAPAPAPTAGASGGGQSMQAMDGKCCCDEQKMRQMVQEMMPQMMNQMMGHGVQGKSGQQTDDTGHAKP